MKRFPRVLFVSNPWIHLCVLWLSLILGLVVVNTIHTKEFTVHSQEAGNYEKDRVWSVFESRLEIYRENLTDLRNNLFIQLLLIAASIALIASRSDTFEFSLISQHVPTRFVAYALPACLAYIWIRFGYLLNEIIKQRMDLWTLAGSMEGSLIRPLLSDGGIIDGWFLVFRSAFIAPVVSGPLPIVRTFAVGFGMFLGLSNGCMLGMPLYCTRRFARTDTSRRTQVFLFYLWAILLSMTHYSFYCFGSHPNFVSLVAVVTSALVATVIANVKIRK